MFKEVYFPQLRQQPVRNEKVEMSDMSMFSGEPQSSLSWEGDPCVWVREGETEARSGLGTWGAGTGVNNALWKSLGFQADILGGSDA